jgi:hypothetical protein
MPVDNRVHFVHAFHFTHHPTPPRAECLDGY